MVEPAREQDEAALEVRRIEARRGGARVAAEHIVLKKGEVAALCGPSGSGKSLLLWALAGLGATREMSVQAEEYRLLDRRIGDPGAEIRCGEIALMAQPPELVLDFYRRALDQIAGMLRCCRKGQTGAASLLAAEMVEKLGFSAASFQRYPHQLSGGMAQIAALLIALAADTPILLLDEPFSRLNARTAKAANEIVADAAAAGKAVCYATHDVREALARATRLHILYGGWLVETLPAAKATQARHPYTGALLGAALGLDMPAPTGSFDGPSATGCVYFRACSQRRQLCERMPPPWRETPQGGYACHFPREGEMRRKRSSSNAPRLPAAERVAFKAANLWWRYERKGRDILRGVDLEIREGEIVAVIGDNGSGKSTLCALVGGLLKARQGTLEWLGGPLPRRRAGRIVQWLPQNPLDAFDPRQRIGEALAEPMMGLGLCDERKEVPARYARLFERLGLPWDLLERTCEQASHGQLLRLALARAMACEPAILVCDEITAALDAILARITMEWIVGWAQESQRTVMWVTHDLRLAREYAHRVLRIEGGKLSSIELEHEGRLGKPGSFENGSSRNSAGKSA